MEIFQDMLVNALTPITLISGVGLLMLCMTTRYNHATDRIRQLIKNVRTAAGATSRTLTVKFV